MREEVLLVGGEELGMRGRLDLPGLPDYLGPGLSLVFVGFNPGERSAETGHYYAYPGNRFWWLLAEAGLTERRLSPQEDRLLPGLGYGLTDLVAQPSKSSGDLSGWELRRGRASLLEKLSRSAPGVICYNGKGVYAAASGRSRFGYGLQGDRLLPESRDFVAASPSGRSREPLAEKLALYRELAALVSPE